MCLWWARACRSRGIIVYCLLFVAVCIDEAWPGVVSVAVGGREMRCRCSPCLCEVFPRGSTFEAVSFRSLREPRTRVALCGGRGRRRPEERSGRDGRLTSCIVVDTYLEQISAKRTGPVGYVYILTPLFSASSSCDISIYSSGMSRPITFEPLPLRPRSALQLYIGAACMFTISFLSALLALSYFYCPAHVRTFISTVFFFIFYHYNLCENALTDYMGQPIV